MNTVGRVPKRNHITRMQRLARERAEVQVRRVPWQRLLHTRNEYIDWQEFYLMGPLVSGNRNTAFRIIGQQHLLRTNDSI